MCKFGDIIVVQKYKGDDGKELSKHSFVVIEDTPGEISGLNYDLVANVMSSFKNEEHRKMKIKFKENIEVISDDIVGEYKNSKSGYIKADQLFYFDKKKLDYYVFAHITPDLLDELLKLIISLEVENRLKTNVLNLEETVQN